MDARPEVFISYARKDGEALARWIRERLGREHTDLRLWQDRTEMEGGAGWWKQITEALDVVEVMVLVLTPGAVASPLVRKEWQYARQRGVCIYPVMGKFAPKPDFSAMPRWVSKVHCYDLDIEWDNFVLHLKLKRLGRAARVPFMAPDLPEGYIERPWESGRLLALLLDRERNDPVAITTSLIGAGGFGKTTLATALCHDENLITAFDDGILWVTLGENPNILNGLAKLDTALSGRDPGFRDVEQAAQHLAARLEDKSCLIVLDDVWKPEDLAPFLRGGKTCARLITTRQFEVALEGHCQRVDVDEMTPDEAVRLLTVRLDPPPADLEPFRALAQSLGAWPLLLELIGSVLHRRIQRGDTPAGALDYIARGLDQEGVTAFDQKGMTALDRSAAAGRRRSIARTLEVSLGLLDEADTRRYFELAIFAENVDIPLVTLKALWTLESFGTEEMAGRLADLSLLKYDLQTGTVRLHGVFRKYLDERLADAPAVHARLVDAWGNPYDLSGAFAWHWLSYHLVAANRRGRLRELLLDFAWLRAKLEATDVVSLLADFDPLLDDPDLRLVQGAIRLSAHVFAKDKEQLRSQLYGRLVPWETPVLYDLKAQMASAEGEPWLRSLIPCLMPPGGSLLRTLEGHGDAVSAVTVLPDGRHALSASDDQTLMLWDVQAGRATRTLQGHTGPVGAVAVLPDGRHALSASDDQTLMLWDLQTGRSLRTLQGHSDRVTAVTALPDGHHVLSASADRTLMLWDLQIDRATCTLQGHGDEVTAVTALPDGKHVLSASADHTLMLWDLQAGRSLRTLQGHSDWVRAVAALPDGRRALSASDDTTLKLWDLQTGRVLHTMQGHAGWVRAVAILPDSQHALSASADGTLKLWDLKVGRALFTLEGHSGTVRAVAALPNARHALSASADGTLKLWNLETGREGRTVEGHASPVHAVAVTPDGRHAISAAHDRTPKLWDLRSGQVLRTLEGHALRVTAVAVTPDGRHAISAAHDRTLKLWDLQSGQLLLTLEGHARGVNAVAVTPDGRHAISASRDRTLRIWDLKSGALLVTFHGDADFITCGVAPDGLTFLGGDEGGRVYFLRLEGA